MQNSLTTKHEIRHRLHILAEEGQLTELEAENLQEKLVSIRFHSIEDARLKRFIEFSPYPFLDNILTELEIPTRDDLQKLIRQLDELTVKIEQIEKSEA